MYTSIYNKVLIILFGAIAQESSWTEINEHTTESQERQELILDPLKLRMIDFSAALPYSHTLSTSLLFRDDDDLRLIFGYRNYNFNKTLHFVTVLSSCRQQNRFDRWSFVTSALIAIHF